MTLDLYHAGLQQKEFEREKTVQNKKSIFDVSAVAVDIIFH